MSEQPSKAALLTFLNGHWSKAQAPESGCWVEVTSAVTADPSDRAGQPVKLPVQVSMYLLLASVHIYDSIPKQKWLVSTNKERQDFHASGGVRPSRGICRPRRYETSISRLTIRGCGHLDFARTLTCQYFKLTAHSLHNVQITGIVSPVLPFCSFNVP